MALLFCTYIVVDQASIYDYSVKGNHQLFTVYKTLDSEEGLVGYLKGNDDGEYRACFIAEKIHEGDCVYLRGSGYTYVVVKIGR